MQHLLRKKAVGGVGVSIRDSQLRFVEFVPHSTDGDLVLSSWGTVGIQYDTVDQGRILDIHAVRDSVKQLALRTNCEALVFASWGDDSLDQEWKELFTIGGFADVSAVARGSVLDLLSLSRAGESQSVLFFETPEQAYLYHAGELLSTHSYPWQVDDVLALQDQVTATDNSPLYLCGDLPEEASVVESVMRDYDIFVQLGALWRQCFDLRVRVPDMHRNESFSYALCIANALHASRYIQTSDEQQLSSRVLKKLTLGAVSTDESESQTENQEESIENQTEPVSVLDHVTKKTDTTKTSTAAVTVPEPARAGSLQDAIGDEDSLQMTAEPDSEEAPVEKRSVWLQDVDEMIYKMMGAKRD